MKVRNAGDAASAEARQAGMQGLQHGALAGSGRAHLASKALAGVAQLQQQLLQVVVDVDPVLRVRVVCQQHRLLRQAHLRRARLCWHTPQPPRDASQFP